jgi:hypothetical protein
MPNVRAANKVKIGAWVDRMDAANLRQFAASQGLHVSTLIEAAVIKSLPMLFAQASQSSQLTPPSQIGTPFIEAAK